jgi:hypothetical protein
MAVTTLSAEATRLTQAADAEGITLRLLGGIAVRLRSPSAQHRSLQRTSGDIDFCALSDDLPALEPFFVSMGYEPWLPFNRLNAEISQRFDHVDSDLSIDVFIDRLQMCHTLDLRRRLRLDSPTLPLADLLLSKLQIVELNEKDVQDVLALVRDHAVGHGEDPALIDADRIAEVCADDWGWYRTTIGSLQRCREGVDRYLEGEAIATGRLDAIADAIEQAPKSRRWKLRAKVGERKRWYELPEDPERKA